MARDTTALAAALAAVLAEPLEGDVSIVGLQRLSGGASRETWAFDAVGGGVGAAEPRPLVLRRNPPGVASKGMVREAHLLRAAAAVGVAVPAIVTASDDPDHLGAAYVVMDRIEGETIPRRILRDERFATARPLLAAQCGTALAAIHRIPTDAVPGLEADDQLEQFRALFDGLGQAHPAFELGFRWLEQNRPVAGARAVVHGDFRNGNLIVGEEGMRAVLDWELAHLGDPLEDLGWLCVKSWRFGSAQPVGGFGDYDELVGAYEAAGGVPVDRAALHWWETMGTLKWGVMCILQTLAHLSGAVRSVELAAIGRRVCEVEHDLLGCLMLEDRA